MLGPSPRAHRKCISSYLSFAVRSPGAPTKLVFGIIFTPLHPPLLARRKTAQCRGLRTGHLMTLSRWSPYQVCYRLCTSAQLLWHQPLRRMFLCEQILSSPKKKKNTLEFFFPFVHSPCLASTGESQSFLWWKITAFQNPLPESPRDLFFSSFLI